MRIFISLNGGGCSDITRYCEVTPGTPEYLFGREAMLRDLKSVIAGARAAGARRIAVCDGSMGGGSLPLSGTGADVVIRGEDAPLGKMQGIEQGYDRVYFLGYCARAGMGGVMAHTFWPETVKNISFDGWPVGELEANAVLAQSFGARPAFLSGDQILVGESQKSFPQMAMVTVKFAYGNSCAACFPEMGKKLETVAGEAIRIPLAGGVRPPVQVEVTYYDDTTQSYEVSDYRDTYQEMITDIRRMDKLRKQG